MEWKYFDALRSADMKLDSVRHNSEASLNSADSNVLWRRADEKAKSPVKLHLDRQKLRRCMRLKDEEGLELLSYQHNSISRIEHLNGYRKLAFLDFYDNRIAEITGLGSLPSLRILMLGKNQLSTLSGLSALTQLEVLDVHSNRVERLEGLAGLRELKVLNVSGNRLASLEGIGCLESLEELNLRRNKLTEMGPELGQLKALERLFLSFNSLESSDALWDDLVGCASVSELALDGNPLANETHYKTRVLKCLPGLRQLDRRRISEGERRVIERAVAKDALRTKARDEAYRRDSAKQRRIQEAMEEWEEGGVPLRRGLSSLQSTLVSEKTVLFGTSKPEREDGSGYAEIEGAVLKFYGPDSLAALDKPWGHQAVASVQEARFKFIDFSVDAEPQLAKLRLKFPRIQSLAFAYANVCAYSQLDALLALKTLQRLTISPKGNPVARFALWEQYVCFTIARPLGLQELNGKPISDLHVDKATEIFGNYTAQLGQLHPVLKTILLNTGRNKSETPASVRNLSSMELHSQAKTPSRKFRELVWDKASRLVTDQGASARSEDELRKEIDRQWPAAFAAAVETIRVDMENPSMSRWSNFERWRRKQRADSN